MEFLSRKQSVIEEEIKLMHHVHASIGGLIHRERQVIEMLNSGTFIVEEKETDG